MNTSSSLQGTIYLLDNVDSFTYNLVDELSQLGFRLLVYRNDVSADFIVQQMRADAEHGPVMLCLSPGPGHPSQAGCLLSLIDKVRGEFPILGICLGFQALIQQSGGRVDKSPRLMHGKSSPMQLGQHPVFASLQSPMQVARYHSLQAFDLPSEVELIADVDEIPMAAYHPSQAWIGFQFHPESLLTTHGSQLLQNTAAYLLAKAESLQCNP